MCIITIAYKVDEENPLIVVANRDEFENRPAKQAGFWEEDAQVFGGRDLEKGGSWLAIHKNGRFAAVTNYRDFSLKLDGEKSRGHIVNDFILGHDDATTFLEKIKAEGSLYGPFNVIVYDGEKMMHYNNIHDDLQEMTAGVHCVSNATLNTPWPKVERMKQLVNVAIQDDASADDLVAIGKDVEKPVDERLPHTGAGLEMERELSSIFVLREVYSTRCTTVIKANSKQIEFIEQTYDHGEATSCVKEIY